MPEYVDLHAHTTASDGTTSPGELIRAAARCRLAAIAVTDHDTTAGVTEAMDAAADLPIVLVPGIELSATWRETSLHVLGLGIDPSCEQLQNVLTKMRAGREKRNWQIVQRLRERGVAITMEEVVQAARNRSDGEDTPVIGRPHIAEALRRGDYVRDIAEAFDKWIGRGCPAYMPRWRPTPEEAFAAISAADGASILAHPGHISCDNTAQYERVVREMIAAGLDGMEAYHSDHSPVQTRTFLDLAKRFGLLVTGGSDFHGASKPEVRLGRPRVPASVVASHPLGRRLLGR
jgi:hypothetical protein